MEGIDTEQANLFSSIFVTLFLIIFHLHGSGISNASAKTKNRWEPLSVSL